MWIFVNFMKKINEDSNKGFESYNYFKEHYKKWGLIQVKIEIE